MGRVAPSVAHDRRERVAQLTLAGKTTAFIASELGITARSAQRHQVALGINHRAPPPLTETEKSRIRDMLDDGCPCTEIARTIGRNVTTIHHHYRGQSRWEPIGRYHAKIARQLGLSLADGR